MKVATVVGARPQFIKAATFSRALRERHTEVLIHTGQHYDRELSDVFFTELDLPRPDHELGVGSASPSRQTATILERIEPVLRDERPEWVVVFGDTTSTLAGALAAAQMNVPLAHVEAGLRSFNRSMPEETNRVVTDHCADILFCPTETAMSHLAREGLSERAHLTGDVMADSLEQHRAAIEARTDLVERLDVEPGAYYLATAHRAANTDDPSALGRIVDAFGRIDATVVFPIHPRTKKAIEAAGLKVPANVSAIEPAGYLDTLALQAHACAVLTDSGGMQKEAYLLGVPCVTLRDETEWPETLVDGWNVLAGTDVERIVEAATRPRPTTERPGVFGDGRAAQRMVDLLHHDPSHRGRLD